PPPPPPSCGVPPPQTVSEVPGFRLVPPTPVAYGWSAGSSTSRLLKPNRSQSAEPESPDAAKNERPATAAIWSSLSVAACDDGSSTASHDPQLSEMIVRCSLLRRRSIESRTPAIVPLLGAT